MLVLRWFPQLCVLGMSLHFLDLVTSLARTAAAAAQKLLFPASPRAAVMTSSEADVGLSLVRDRRIRRHAERVEAAFAIR